MADFIESLLFKHVKLSSIDEGKLLRKRASLADSLELTKSISRELETQSARARIEDTIGVCMILTTFVTDIVRDTVGVQLAKTNPLMKLGLEKIYDKARERKWKHSRYEKDIAEVEKNIGYLEKLAALDKTGMLAMTVTIHKHMLSNMIGLKGYTEDSAAARMAVAKAIASLRKNIDALEKENARIQFYLDTGDGGAPQQRMTPMQAPVALGRLG